MFRYKVRGGGCRAWIGHKGVGKNSVQAAGAKALRSGALGVFAEQRGTSDCGVWCGPQQCWDVRSGAGQVCLMGHAEQPGLYV